MKIETIFKYNLDFNLYHTLIMIQEKSEYLNNPIVKHWISLLEIKKFVENNEITQLGIKVLKECGSFDKSINYLKLHKNLENELITLTGKKQKVLQGTYSFLPNVRDLQKKLDGIILKHKLKDTSKIEKVLIEYVKKCHKKSFDKVQLISYYIEKNGISNFVNDYNNFEEVKEKEENIKEVKNLF